MRIVAAVLFLAGARAEDVDRPSRTGHLGKSTYAMSHPWAFKTFMESYFPTAVQTETQNSTKKCVEWVKLCIDDGSGTQQRACSETTGAQLHSVGAYLSGAFEVSHAQNRRTPFDDAAARDRLKNRERRRRRRGRGRARRSRRPRARLGEAAAPSRARGIEYFERDR